MLSKKQASKEVEKVKRQSGTEIGRDFKEAYGEAFGKLSKGEMSKAIALIKQNL
jgi:hypothetical protein